MRLKQVGSEVCVNDSRFTSKATVKLVDGLKATVTHKSGSAQPVAAVSLTGRDWEVAYDFQKQDTRMKWKARVGQSSLTVKQHVPGGNWALVPNPVFELSRGGLMGEGSKLVCHYDCMERVGGIEEKVYAGEDREHKAWIRLSTKAGPVAGLRSKLGKGPLLHSAAATFSQKGGWQLCAKSKFADGTKVKTSYSVASDSLVIAAKHTPQRDGKDDARPTLSLSIRTSVKQQADPQINLGIKWDR